MRKDVIYCFGRPANDDGMVYMSCPVGTLCSHCRGTIKKGDSGYMLPHGPVVHAHCFMDFGMGIKFISNREKEENLRNEQSWRFRFGSSGDD